MARTERSRAFLLRSLAYGDADRIVTLFTEAHGKVSAIARSARRSTRRFGGALEPYALLEVEVAFGSGELARLQSASVLRAHPGILRDLGRMTLAAAGLELVREALEAREPEPRLLEAIEAFLEALEAASSDGALEALHLAFRLRTLALIGLAPGLDVCGRCGKPAPTGKAAAFDPARGAIFCRACGGAPIVLSGSMRARMISASGRDFVATGEGWLEPELERARAAIDAFTEAHLHRRLAGPGLVSQVREVLGGYDRERER